MIIYNFDFVIFQDADLDILESDEDEIDEDSAVYLESLQDKLNKHVNGNMQVCFCFFAESSLQLIPFPRSLKTPLIFAFSNSKVY